jgi:predicted MFS family arabinose efflux permease
LVLGLAALALASIVGFGMVERRAPEPVLPLRLFANRTFAVTSAVGFIVGFALFGAITYVPLFLQVVSGASPTLSGLLLMPMMAGMLVTSILSGHIISRTGRYRFFPIFGTAVLCFALWLLARINIQTSQAWVAVLMLVIGFGLGNVMQVLLIAAQNAVGYRDLGVATSGATLFRLIGGSFGTAVLGAIFASRLDYHLAGMAASGTRIPDLGSGMGPQQIAQLPATLRSAYAQACATSLQTVFLVAAAVSFGGFLLAWLLPETPLQQTITTATRESLGVDIAETFAMPTDAD